MASLTNALQQLRAERSRAQLELEKLDQAISVIESLNGTGASRKSTRPTRVVSAASRRKMALAQRARWARARNGSQPVTGTAKTTGLTVVKRTMSAAVRRKIAAAQKARWAKIRVHQKKAA
jgi:phage major head subunit gpT-like protein